MHLGTWSRCKHVLAACMYIRMRVHVYEYNYAYLDKRDCTCNGRRVNMLWCETRTCASPQCEFESIMALTCLVVSINFRSLRKFCSLFKSSDHASSRAPIMGYSRGIDAYADDNDDSDD